MAFGWHAEPEAPATGYVADVLAWSAGRRVVFEVQLSKQSDIEYEDRTEVRRTDGAEVVWLVRARKPRSRWDVPDPLLTARPDMPVVQIMTDDTDALMVGRDRRSNPLGRVRVGVPCRTAHAA